jgi:hypothetical protein
VVAVRHLRWHMAAMFSPATVISYVDRQALSVNALFIDLVPSNVQYSSWSRHSSSPVASGRA